MVEKSGLHINLIQPISAKQRKKSEILIYFREKILMNIPDNYDDALSKVTILNNPSGILSEISRPEIGARFRTVLDTRFFVKCWKVLK